MASVCGSLTQPTVWPQSTSGVRKSGQSCVVLQSGGDGTEVDGGFTSELRQYVWKTLLLLWGRVKDL